MLTVSIVTYKTELSELELCMDSLGAKSVGRIYVIDNASEKRIEEFCKGRKNVEYYPRPNLGYGAGHNFAMRKAMALGSKYHLVLNSDVRFDPSILDKAVEFMDSHPDVGQLHPAVYYPNGEVQYTVRLIPTPLDVFGRRFLPNKLFAPRNKHYTLAKMDRSKVYDIPYHQGSFMFLRCSALEEVGLFDERFFMYAEDIDMSRRIHARFRTLYWPEISIVHDHRAASYHSKKMLGVHIRNLMRYFNKWGWFIDPERRLFNRKLLKSLKSEGRKAGSPS